MWVTYSNETSEDSNEIRAHPDSKEPTVIDQLRRTIRNVIITVDSVLFSTSVHCFRNMF